MDTKTEGRLRAKEKPTSKRELPQPTGQAPEIESQVVDPAVTLQRAMSRAAGGMTPADVAALQRTVGNRVANQVLTTRGRGRPTARTAPAIPLQAKLAVNPPGDAYEREADQVADQIVSQTEGPSFVQRAEAPEKEVMAKPLAHERTHVVQRTGSAVQRKTQDAVITEATYLRKKGKSKSGSNSILHGTRVPPKLAAGEEVVVDDAVKFRSRLGSDSPQEGDRSKPRDEWSLWYKAEAKGSEATGYLREGTYEHANKEPSEETVQVPKEVLKRLPHMPKEEAKSTIDKITKEGREYGATVGGGLGKVAGGLVSVPVMILMAILQVPTEAGVEVIDAIIAAGGAVGKGIGWLLGVGGSLLGKGIEKTDKAGQWVGEKLGQLAGGITAIPVGILMGILHIPPEAADKVFEGLVRGGGWLGKKAFQMALNPVTKSWDLLKLTIGGGFISKWKQYRKEIGKLGATLKTIVDVAKATASAAAWLTLLFSILNIFVGPGALTPVIGVLGWIAFIGAVVQAAFSGLLRIRLQFFKESDFEDEEAWKKVKMHRGQANLDFITGLIGSFVGGWVPHMAGGAVGDVGGLTAPDTTVMADITSGATSGAAAGGVGLDQVLGEIEERNEGRMKKKYGSGVVQRTPDETGSQMPEGGLPEGMAEQIDQALEKALELKQILQENKEAAAKSKTKTSSAAPEIENAEQELEKHPELQQIGEMKSKVGEAESGVAKGEQTAEQHKPTEKQVKETDEAEVETMEARVEVAEQHAERDPTSIKRGEAKQVAAQVEQIKAEPKKAAWYKRAWRSIKKWIAKLFSRFVNVKKRIAKLFGKAKEKLTGIAVKALGIDKPVQELDKNLKGAKDELPNELASLDEEQRVSGQGADSIDGLIKQLEQAKTQAK
jgi:hypothetical protein